jgi:hypothetical protein
MSMIHPPLSERTPIGSLDAWNLVLRCPRCGDRTKPASTPFPAFGLAREVGEITPRLSCNACQSKPVALFGTNTWATKYGRDPVREDWSFLLPKIEDKAA